MFFLLVRRLIMISTPGHFILLIHFVLEVLPVDIMFPGHFCLLLIMGFSKIYTSLRYAHVKTKIYLLYKFWLLRKAGHYFLVSRLSVLGGSHLYTRDKKKSI